LISAQLLADGTKLKASITKNKASVSKNRVLTIKLPAAAPDPIATVIKVDVKGKIDDVISIK